MSEKQAVVAIAAALVQVRILDAEPQTPFTSIYQALEDVERLISHHKDQFGVYSLHFQQGCEEFLLLSNTLAVKALQRSSLEDVANSDQCGNLLQRAEQHTRHTEYLRSIPEAQHVSRRKVFRLITLNNLACHAKQTGKSIAAIGFLEEALKLQLKSQTAECSHFTVPVSEIALTRLNLCAVFSQLDHHSAAAAHAKAVVAQLSVVQNSDILSPDIAQLLLVANYNLAVEMEHLCDYNAAWRHYKSVITTAERHHLQNDLVESVRVILSQGSRRISRPGGKRFSPRTPPETYNSYHRLLFPKSLRDTPA